MICISEQSLRELFSVQAETDAGRLHQLDLHQQELTSASQALLSSLTELEREKAWLQHADFLWEQLLELSQTTQVSLMSSILK